MLQNRPAIYIVDEIHEEISENLRSIKPITNGAGSASIEFAIHSLSYIKMIMMT